MKDRLPILLLLAVLLVLVGCEPLPPRHGEVVVRDQNARLVIVFSDRDRAIIQEWYEERRRHLPPGLAKKGKVPPGHARQWARWDSLPPGIAYRPLPPELERRLSRLPDDHVRVVVGTDVMIMNVRTRVIFDILYDLADD